MGAGGDRKVTPGVTGSSRARAPIDPAVWYLGLVKRLRGRIVVTRLKYPQKNTSIGLYRRNPTSFTRSRASGHWEERERATPREVRRDFSTRSGGRSSFSDAVNGVPATADVKLAGRAVDRGGRLSALFRGTAAVCAAHDELRRHARWRLVASNTLFHLIGKTGRFGQASPRMAARGSKSLIPVPGQNDPRRQAAHHSGDRPFRGSGLHHPRRLNTVGENLATHQGREDRAA